MALLAAIEVRSGCELSLMHILVAVHALGKGDLVARLPAPGNVALRAGYAGVFSFEGISAGGVLLYVEPGGFEPVHGMAAGALDTACSLSKLTAVNVLMAICALLKRERFFEIASLMAGQAIDSLMLSQQRVLGSRVIELSVYVLK